MPGMAPSKPAQMDTVEVHRLQALVETQRKHIEDLNAQLHEVLEVKKQQQLQLVEQSPARRNVKQLLARAAADNTALAKKVEELRAQRNALAVTKAALTAQMSQLIRGAADGVQRESQHEHLLAQVQQLYQLTGQQGADQPTAQMAAVITFINKACKQHRALQVELQRYKQFAVQRTETPPAAPQPAGTPLTLSPSGQQLDKKATSQLIWWDGSCTELGKSAASSKVDETPVAAAASSCSGGTSYRTGQSYLSDMSYISPMRGSSSKAETTPASKTPKAAHVQFDDGLGSPLSCQSLSQFSSSKGTPGADLTPRRLDLDVTPTSRYQNHGLCDSGTCSSSSNSETCITPAAVVRGLDQTPSKDQCGSNRCSLDFGCSPSPMALFSPVFGFNPGDLGEAGSVYRSCNRGSLSAMAEGPSGSRHTGGLQLEEEFKLAACGSLWPSPAISASDCRTNSSLSHAAWLGSPNSNTVPLLDLSSVLNAHDSHLDAEWSEDDHQQQQPAGRSNRRRRLLMTSLLVIAPLTMAAAAGGSVAWRFKRDEVLMVAAALREGLRVAAQQSQVGAALGWKHCQHGWAHARRLVQRCRTGKIAGKVYDHGSEAQQAAAGEPAE